MPIPALISPISASRSIGSSSSPAFTIAGTTFKPPRATSRIRRAMRRKLTEAKPCRPTIAPATGGNVNAPAFSLTRADRPRVTGGGRVHRQYLVEFCETGDHVCLGYINGVVDLASMIPSLPKPGSPIFCIPSNVTRRQVADIVATHLRDNPEYRNNEALVEIFVALHQTFPCA
jgi:Rap1a immunity proteins